MAAEVELFKNEKAKSAIWGHFKLKKENQKIVNNVAVCNICNETIKYSGGTTNLASHMRRHHGNVKINDQPDKNCPAANASTSTPMSKGQVNISTMLSGGSFGSKYPSQSPRASAITDQIARLIVKDLRPYSMVEGTEFVRLLKILDPRYTIPGRKQFSEIIIPKMYNEEQSKLKLKIKNADKVALTTDGWTSRSTDSFITITAIFLDSDWSLQNFVLQTRVLSENHTGENIADMLQQAVEEWGLPSNPRPPIVTDNASNMEKAGIMFQAEYHIKCYAHTLNLAAQKSLKVKQVSHILSRMRKIVAFFHRSSVATAKLREQADILHLPKHKLLIDVPTRWNSAYDMISRFLEMQCAVTTVLRMKEISKFRDKDINSFTDEDLTFAENVMECLRPLKTVTTSLCTERMPTISVIMPIQHTLLHKMQTKDDDCNGIKQMKNTIVQDLQHRYDHQRDILSIASFIDPRFKSLPFLADDSLKDEVHSSVINKLMEIGPMKIKEEPKETTTPPLPSAPMLDQIQTTDDSISSNKEDIDANNNSPQRKKVKQEDLASLFSDVYVVSYTPATEKSLYEKATENIEIYKSLPPVPFDHDPLQWWKLHDQKVPLLATLARKILCIPATSVASERVFSTAGDIVSSQRACLNPTHVDKLIFLKKNLQ